ncbi:MAG: hypothetical protein HYX34_05785 [Actinobacteria bacterium]|nr:hypothetical protein [Actinomycetota bacterium]
MSLSTAPATAVRAARIAALSIAVAAGLSQDDTARELTSALPVSLARRRLYRAVVVLPGAALSWAVTVASIARLIGPLPSAALTTELAAFIAVASMSSVVLAALTPERQGGVAAAPAVFAAYAAGGLLYRPLLASGPLEAGWGPAHRLFGAVALVGSAGYALASWWPDLRWRLARRG